MPRISLTNEVPTNLWTSPYVPNEAWDAGQIDEALIAGLTSDRNLSIIAADAWQTSTQLAFKNLAVSVGIPQKQVQAVRSVVGGIAPITSEVASKIASELATSGVGVATDLIGAVPILGAVARAVVGVVKMLIGLNRKQHEGYRVVQQLPSLQKWEDVVDEAATNDLIRRLSTYDWTNVFMPAYRGDWRLYDAENGFYGRGNESVSGGAGFMPGTQRSARIAQAAFQNLAEGGRMRDELVPIAQNTGSFFPGVSNLGVVLDQQVQKAQAQMYCVDTVPVDQAWMEYFLGLRSLSARIFNGQEHTTKLDKLNQARRLQVAMSVATPLAIRPGSGGKIGIPMGWSPQMDLTDPWKRYIEPWCTRLRRRQFKYTETLVVAYASEKSAAITQNPILREKFDEMRRVLLTHPARMDVVMPDVLDRDYKAALREARRNWRPDSFAATPTDPLFRPRRTNAPTDGAVGPGGGAPFDDGSSEGSKLWWLAVLGLAGFAYYKTRK